MTALAEKLETAGADTVGAKLIAAIIEGLRRHPDSPVNAWRHAGATYGHGLARSLMEDMQGVDKGVSPAPYQPRVVTEQKLREQRERREKLLSAVSKYRDSHGTPWSEVKWSSLATRARDGEECRALLKAGPRDMPNVERSVKYVLGNGDEMKGIAVADKIIEDIRLCRRSIV